jgi:hypothetical protein
MSRGSFSYWFLVIFISKAAFVIINIFIAYGILNYADLYAHLYLRFPLFPVVAMLLLAFGFYCLLGGIEQNCQNTAYAIKKQNLISIHTAWIYTVFAAAFFLLNVDSQFNGKNT